MDAFEQRLNELRAVERLGTTAHIITAAKEILASVDELDIDVDEELFRAADKLREFGVSISEIIEAVSARASERLKPRLVQ